MPGRRAFQARVRRKCFVYVIHHQIEIPIQWQISMLLGACYLDRVELPTPTAGLGVWQVPHSTSDPVCQPMDLAGHRHTIFSDRGNQDCKTRLLTIAVRASVSSATTYANVSMSAAIPNA